MLRLSDGRICPALLDGDDQLYVPTRAGAKTVRRLICGSELIGLVEDDGLICYRAAADQVKRLREGTIAVSAVQIAPYGEIHAGVWPAQV